MDWEEVESVSLEKKLKKEIYEEICEVNGGKICDAAIKKLKAKNGTLKKANDSDASDDEPVSLSSTPVHSRPFPGQLVDTISSMVDMIKESNEANLVAVAEEREERRKMLESA
ncbi:hypothetical protein HDU98_004903 [Podochytrium sp. JEL0797]|nr:hypothetical protein HDU98_004903 [Podochytrium sp. JEL0797]